MTSKNVKQAGTVASFLNRNPKLAKNVVPSEYQGAVKVAGKAYDFREEHGNKNKQIDFFGSLKGEQKSFEKPSVSTMSNVAEPPKQSLRKPPKPPPAKKPPSKVAMDLNAGWGNDGSAHEAQVVGEPTDNK